MARDRILRTALTLACAAIGLVVPARVVAQAPVALRGPFIGVGVGVGAVAVRDGGDSRFGPNLHGRAGWGFAHGIAAVVEAGVYGLGDDRPQNGDVVIVDPPGGGQGTQVVRRPSVLGTVSVLASVQAGLPGGFYVRPGVGIGQHAFATYNLSGSDTPTAETSHEAGPAAGLALGRLTNLSRRLPVAVEAAALWSHGEDSTGSRVAVVLQVVPMLRF